MAIQWDIRTPNPMVPLQAAALGETMRRNRMQEQRWARQDETAAEKARRDAERYGLEQARAALTDYARLNQAVAALPAEQQDAAFARGMQFLRATHPTRNGVDPWATVTDRLEAGEQENLAALSPFLETQGESYALKQGLDDQGNPAWFRVSETSGEVLPTGLSAVPRQSLVSIQAGGASQAGTRPATQAEADALGVPREGLMHRTSKEGEVTYSRLPAAPGESAAAGQEAKLAIAQQEANQAIDSYMQAVKDWRADKLDTDKRIAANAERRKLVEAVATVNAQGLAKTESDIRRAEEQVPDFMSIGQLAGSIAGGDPVMTALEALRSRQQRTPLPTGDVPTPPAQGNVPGDWPATMEGKRVVETRTTDQGVRYVRTEDGEAYRLDD